MIISIDIYAPLQAADTPRLGQPLSAEQAREADTVVLPDGSGLPRGAGTAVEGAQIYATRCVACHGPEGRGGAGGELAGGDPDLTRDYPDQTIGTYWPYATTLFDFVRRAMPLDAPWSLSDAQVYAVCAYLLYLNGIVGEDAVLDAATLSALKMPNRDGFDPVDASPQGARHAPAGGTD